MDRLADSTAELCQGRKNRYIGWEGVPMHDNPDVLMQDTGPNN